MLSIWERAIAWLVGFCWWKYSIFSFSLLQSVRAILSGKYSQKLMEPATWCFDRKLSAETWTLTLFTLLLATFWSRVAAFQPQYGTHALAIRMRGLKYFKQNTTTTNNNNRKVKAHYYFFKKKNAQDETIIQQQKPKVQSALLTW